METLNTIPCVIGYIALGIIALFVLGAIYALKPEIRPDSYTLVLECDDGLPEVQSYDSYEEAEQAGKEQMERHDEVIGYRIEPWYCLVATTAMQANASRDNKR